ncbi:MAG: cellulase family glycosylhydrolase [Anaerolineales bacterium]
MYRRIIIICAILILGLSITLTYRDTAYAATPASIQGLHVSGNKILNTAGQTVRLFGVNHAGGEYMCAHLAGIFDGPTDPVAVQAMLTWKVNAVRIPLNEDCWLAINGIPSQWSGAPYQQAIVNYVNLLNSVGIVAILDLHWSAPGTYMAKRQANMPDADHSTAFWTSVATTFKSNSSVIFELFNEPYPDNNSDSTAGWTCWRDGGACGHVPDDNGADVPFTAVGMQSLVNTVRGTGATNIIMLGGLEYSNALSQWLTYKPTDSAGNLAASWHLYNFNLCNNSTCWTTNVLPVLNSVPLVTGELGENDCAHTFVDTAMTWLDTYSTTSYLGWGWNAWGSGMCGSGPILINDWLGSPNAFGQGFKDHYNSLMPGATVTPVATATVGPGVLSMALEGSGSDTTSQSQFTYQLQAPSQWDQTNVSARLYFTLDGTQPATNYCFQLNYQTGSATVSGPTQYSGSVYYFTFDYGANVLPRLDLGATPPPAWTLQGTLSMCDHSANLDVTNDWWHTGYAMGSLPTTFTSTNYIPAYVRGIRAAGNEPTSGPTLTPTRTPTPTLTPTRTFTPLVTNTPTRTPTPGPSFTPTITQTPGSGGSLKVQLVTGGTDNTQSTSFNLKVLNTGSTALTNISIRIYFTLDGSETSTMYVLEKYYDQSGVATISGPTLASGSNYYFTVNFGTASLGAGSNWGFNTAMHLSDWSSNYSGTNDWWHTTGALPASYTDWTTIPAYIGSTLTWGTAQP